MCHRPRGSMRVSGRAGVRVRTMGRWRCPTRTRASGHGGAPGAGDGTGEATAGQHQAGRRRLEGGWRDRAGAGQHGFRSGAAAAGLHGGGRATAGGGHGRSTRGASEGGLIGGGRGRLWQGRGAGGRGEGMRWRGRARTGHGERCYERDGGAVTAGEKRWAGASPAFVGSGQRARRGGRGRGGVRVAGDECGGVTGSRARRRNGGLGSGRRGGEEARGFSEVVATTGDAVVAATGAIRGRGEAAAAGSSPGAR